MFSKSPQSDILISPLTPVGCWHFWDTLAVFCRDIVIARIVRIFEFVCSVWGTGVWQQTVGYTSTAQVVCSIGIIRTNRLIRDI